MGVWGAGGVCGVLAGLSTPPRLPGRGGGGARRRRGGGAVVHRTAGQAGHHTEKVLAVQD